MNALRLAPAGLSILVLGAHFLRQGNILLLVVCLVAFALLFVRRPWVPAALLAFLALGAFEWVFTMVKFVAEREALGEPTTRLKLILGGTALVCVASMLAFRARAVRERYAPPATPGADDRPR